MDDLFDSIRKLVAAGKRSYSAHAVREPSADGILIGPWWQPSTRRSSSKKEIEMTRKSTQLIHEGEYAAEVAIELIEDETGWSPYVAEQDVLKLDRVRLALRRGDIAAAGQEARVLRLLPVSA